MKRILFLSLFLAFFVGSASATIIYVPDDYTTIQDAINNSVAGDEIIVRDGTYTENIVIDRAITLRSENGSENCIIDGSDNDVIVIQMSNVIVKGFTVRNGETGIRIDPSFHDYVVITENYVTDQSYCGIDLNTAHYCKITYNTITNCVYALPVYGESNYNYIAHNIIHDNENYGLEVVSGSSNNIFENNSVLRNWYGIMLNDAHNNIFRRNNISDNDYGIVSIFSSDNVFYQNNIGNSYDLWNWGSTIHLNSTSPVRYFLCCEEREGYLGNYWERNTASDENGDGITDSQYCAESGDCDLYPLAHPMPELHPLIISSSAPPTPTPSPTSIPTCTPTEIEMKKEERFDEGFAVGISFSLLFIPLLLIWRWFER